MASSEIRSDALEAPAASGADSLIFCVTLPSVSRLSGDYTQGRRGVQPRSALVTVSLRNGWYRDNSGENVRLQKGDHADDRGACDRIPEHRAEDRPQRVGPLLRVVVACGTGNHDRLGIDHLAHDAAGRVGGDDEDFVQMQLLRRDSLQAAEERV